MPRIVVLTRSAHAREGYDVRLGPLSFVTPADTVGESVGDGLEVVGSAIVATDRRARPLKLKLPIRGESSDDEDATAAGLRLRRQVRQAFDNATLRLQGFYFLWDADPDLDGWLLVGGAEINESDPGISFGDFEMDLSDVYMRGRPGTHRPGRRAMVADLRTGIAPRDTRRMLRSTDFSSHLAPDQGLALPGDVVSVTASGNRPAGAVTAGLEREGRILWRSVAAVDGDVLTYLPDTNVLPGRERYLEIDEAGAVRIWDLSTATTYPPDAAAYDTDADVDPDVGYGWERVLGDVLTPDVPLAIDNGACRLIWLGAGADEGLAIEYWDAAADTFVRAGRVLHALDVREQRIVELTGERAVVEWRAGRYAMRAVLQRGWWGPRLESYDDGGGNAALEYAPTAGGAVSAAEQVPPWVRRISASGTGDRPMLWAPGTADDVVTVSPSIVTGPAARWVRQSVLIAQLAPPPGPDAAALASLSLVDTRCVPVLVGRR